MQPFNVMALFCEDIREEKDDVITLVGIIPDSVNIEQPSNGMSEIGNQTQRVLAKLCIYVRINFDPTFDLGTPEIRLVMPNGEKITLGSIASDIVQKAQSEAKAKGHLLAGVFSRIILAGFRPPAAGIVTLEVEIKGETYAGGALTFMSKERAI